MAPLGGTGAPLTYLVRRLRQLRLRWLTSDGSLLWLVIVLGHEIGSGVLHCVNLTCELAACLFVDEVSGLFDAILNGFFVALNETLSLTLQVVN